MSDVVVVSFFCLLFLVVLVLVFPPARKEAAYHEAGHAFTILFFGERVLRASIPFTRFYNPSVESLYLDKFEYRAPVLCAGIIAQRMFSTRMFVNDKSDQRDFLILCKDHKRLSDEERDNSETYVRELFTQPQNAEKIHKLAKLFLKKRVTTEKEILAAWNE
jgi:hypothetical protein